MALPFSMEMISEVVVFLVPLILSLSVHEFAHAQVAWMLGDDTADRQDRRTLNPISHIDPFGTLAFPIFAFVTGSGFLFGWARPVPVTPMKLSRRYTMKTGMMLVAVAGPLSNLLLAVLCTAALKLYHVSGGSPDGIVFDALFDAVVLNIALFLFNLLPVYPLDGSRVLRGLLPRNATRFLDIMEQNPMILLVAFIAVISYGGELLMTPIVAILHTLLALFGLGG